MARRSTKEALKHAIAGGDSHGGADVNGGGGRSVVAGGRDENIGRGSSRKSRDTNA